MGKKKVNSVVEAPAVVVEIETAPVVEAPAVKSELAKGQEVVMIPLDLISFDPGQPRKVKPEAYLQELGESIRNQGLQTPITVRPDPEKSGCYIVVAGECRTRAAKKVGLETIAAFVTSFTSEKDLRLYQLVENLTRLNMTPLEEIEAYEKFLLLDGNIGELSRRTGKGVETIRADLEMCKLPPEIKKLLNTGELPKAVGRRLAAFPASQVRNAWDVCRGKQGVPKMMKALDAYAGKTAQTSIISMVVQEMEGGDAATARKAYEKLAASVIRYADSPYGNGKSMQVVVAMKREPHQVELLGVTMKKLAEKILNDVATFKAEKEINQPRS